MTQTRPAGFDPDELRSVLARACRQAGLDANGAMLIRGQTNAVFRLAHEPVLVKVARRGTPVGEVRRTVRLVRWLAGRGIPVAPLYPLPAQPVVVDEVAVTFWDYLDQTQGAVRAEDLGKPLQELHLLPHPPVDLPPLDAIAAIRRSVESAMLLKRPVREELMHRAELLAARLRDVEYGLPAAVLHADPQHGNALHDHGGVVLCDWDSARWGQPEWDLVTIEVHCRRFGYGRAQYRAFAEAYGWDVMRWSGYEVLRDLRELRMITTNARKASYLPDTLPEVLRRVRLLRAGDAEGAWSIL
ncbi:phosphotransferase family protein [Streptomyces sp. NPDC050085]|uniref:phosphotransferase family protein n=1 Tax=Streptomyces sp. NPDC050085 TaxID=3365600 RepID=UPI0037BD83FE